ncbi:response regulator transcription factor [Siphonobacter sp. SORGH_AS_0500]|uniref:response regulator transcription factor n=1 Tax=Siphonobacter sp. SORGH_AS_0500 TaxID=1864824 RepID=UPI000CBE84E8|nr:response regulator transcription factor [Siphonobacter sp. SORGH_AS_0500]MDR6197837.1 DNA-binding NarL/FixJ family response regulator [Siphonobacter sp. SORGH_AS_0500]PKK37256.1 hypothetical protein BWI96_07880 [Siphonobacter sp. SORGH_AS_0500]
MNNYPIIQLLIVEDQHILAESFQRLFSEQSQFNVVGICTNKVEALRALSLLKVDIVLLDLSIPEHGKLTPNVDRGFQILEYLQEHMPHVKSIVLSSYNDYSLIKKSIQLGAMGYLLKNTSLTELLKAIQQVHSGTKYLQNQVEEILHRKDLRNETKITETVQLTRREKEVLTFIAQGLTDMDIADEIGLKKFTVSEFRSHLLRKFSAKNAAELVNKAHRQGIL